jgi:ferredoxin
MLIIRQIVGVAFLFFFLSGITFAQDSVQEDEFMSLEESNEIVKSDEFSEDEFSEFSQSETESESCSGSCTGCGAGKSNSQIWWVLSILGMTVVAGVMVRYRSTRNLRGYFLLASLIVLGFYKGGCPCPIMSLHHALFALMGETPNWLGMLWFLGLLPITYLFGKVWCGWICHLGALQEFLYLPGKIKVLQSDKAQRVMRLIRIVLFVALIIQLLITKTNLFKTIDPFKVAFNFQSPHIVAWVLLGLTLLVSVFMYRPFCKTVCPIGLVLGWVSKIPGASILSPKKDCIGCKVCDISCKINAITRSNKTSILDNQECIACGNCITDCSKNTMSFVRNSKKYDSKTVCEKK